MRWLETKAGVLFLGLVTFPLGCGGRSPFVVLTVEAPASPVAEWDHLALGLAADRLEPLSLPDPSLPVTVTVTAPAVGERQLYAELVDAAGAPVARGQTLATFRTTGTPTATLTLARTCATDEECDAAPLCDRASRCDGGVCVADPRSCLSVAYVWPTADAVLVPQAATLLVVFSQAADAASVLAHASLATVDGTRTETLTLTETSLASTFELQPALLLAPLTPYTLRVAAGVTPLDPEAARPSGDDFAVEFTTAPGPDTTPPAPPTAVLVNRDREDRAILSWQNPADIDLAGVLVLRQENGTVIGVPTNGKIYAVGSTVGGARVVGWTQENDWVDGTTAAGYHGYAFFAFDTSANYSAAVTTPLVSEASFTWCPDETGFLTAAATNATSQQLIFSRSPGEEPHLDAGYPIVGDPLGTTAFPAAIRAGPADPVGASTYYLRALISNPTAQYLTEEVSLTASPGLLEPASIIIGSGPDGQPAAHFVVTPYGWTSLEAEYAKGGSATWTPIVGLHDRDVVLPITDVDTYQIRARPLTPAGCSPGPWTTSAQFTWATDVLFVREQGTGDGSSAMAPLGSITAALSVATAKTAILVAAGTYAESISLVPEVQLLGGYSPNFATRDPDIHWSTLTVTADIAVHADDSAITPTTVLDGFHVVSVDGVGVSGTNGASPTLRHNHFTGGQNMGGIGISLADAKDAVIEDNVLAAESGRIYLPAISVDSIIPRSAVGNVIRRNVISGAVVGLRTTTAIDTLIADNVITAGTAIWAGEAAVITGNRILSVGASGDAWGVRLLRQDAVVTGNSIVMGNAGGECIGVDADVAVANCQIVNNVIVGRTCSDKVTGIRVAGTGATLTNNTIVSDIYSRGVVIVTDGAAPQLANNLISAGNGVYEWSSSLKTTEPGSFHNNLILGSSAANYVDADTGTTFHTAADVETDLCAHGIPASGNVMLVASTATAFVDLDGPDNDLLTPDDNDLHLLSSFTTATLGGLDASQNVCGGAGTGCPGTGALSCGDVVDDIDGAARTVPYSIGAYEAD